MKPEDRIKAYNNYIAKYKLLGLTPYEYYADLKHAERDYVAEFHRYYKIIVHNSRVHNFNK